MADQTGGAYAGFGPPRPPPTGNPFPNQGPGHHGMFPPGLRQPVPGPPPKGSLPQGYGPTPPTSNRNEMGEYSTGPPNPMMSNLPVSRSDLQSPPGPHVNGTTMSSYQQGGSMPPVSGSVAGGPPRFPTSTAPPSVGHPPGAGQSHVNNKPDPVSQNQTYPVMNGPSSIPPSYPQFQHTGPNVPGSSQNFIGQTSDSRAGQNFMGPPPVSGTGPTFRGQHPVSNMGQNFGLPPSVGQNFRGQTPVSSSGQNFRGQAPVSLSGQNFVGLPPGSGQNVRGPTPLSGGSQNYGDAPGSVKGQSYKPTMQVGPQGGQSHPPFTQGNLPPHGGPGMSRPGPPGPPPMGSQYQKPSVGPPPTAAELVQRQGQPTPPAGIPGSPGQSGQDRPNLLPVPFHGHGQYSHQISAALTPGVTPNNSGLVTSSEPPSQKSSRAPSPMTNQSYDALEGQFTPGTPNAQGPQQPSEMAPPFSSAPPTSQDMGQRTGSITGARQYPQMPNYMAPPSGQQWQQPAPPSGPMGGQYGQSAPPSGPMGGQYGQQPAPPSGPMSGQYGQHPAPPSGPMGGQYGQHPVPPTGQMGNQPGQQVGPPSGPMGNLSGPSQGQQYNQTGYGGQPGYQPTGATLQGQGMAQPSPGSYPYSQSQVGGSNLSGSGNSSSLSSGFGMMSVQDGQGSLNLLQEKQLIPHTGVEMARPKLPHDFKKVNCHPDVFRCTLNAIPQTSSLLNKSRLPLGILIHPFKDLSQLPVIQSSVIVRCRACRTYINPFVIFVDQRRWKCNLCYKVNELPEEFSFDPVSKTYGEPQRRPEIRSATIEFIAPSEYMLRPPQPAVYLFMVDVSFNAVETGYLNVFCNTLLDELDKIPGDSRTHVGFVAFDRALHFFNLSEGLSQPQMLVVSDLEDVFLPCPDDLLVNLHESKDLVIDLLNQLPTMFEGNRETGSCLGAALQAAYKLMNATGGRVTVMQTILPVIGPGGLQVREDANQRTSKNIPNLGPATDFYKKLALDCSAQQVAVDLFCLNGQYADIASISCISKYSGGCVHYYPSFHTIRNPSLADKFETDFRRYLTRKIGFESVMRIRCTKGLSIHTFHGNFFVRSTDLLSLPNINPDAGFGMQMSIEDNLTDLSTVCFQAALLYTSSKGERRIRVHTLCLPVTNQINEVFAAADQKAIVGLLAKMAVDRCVSSSMTDARDAMLNAAVDSISAYGGMIPSSQRIGALPAPHSLRLVPLYILAMLKSLAFRLGVTTRLDDRVFAMLQCKTQPINYLIQSFYPNLYPVHALDDQKALNRGDITVPQPPVLQLSSAHIDRHGAYLMDTGENMYLYVGSAVTDQFLQDVLDHPNFTSIPEGMTDLPELDNPASERLRNFIQYLLDSRPNGATFLVIREDSKHRMQFFQHMIEDRTESALSYYEFLQHIQKQCKS